MKQRFKGTELTHAKCVNSIIRFYELASSSELIEGIAWYTNANTYCKDLAGRFNLSISQVAGIIAAFSPQTAWDVNKRLALSFLLNPKTTRSTKERLKKARAILKLTSEADIYNALSTNNTAFKTKSFFLNMLNPDLLTSVTIDRHAIAVCIQQTDNVSALDQRFAQLTKGQYDFFAHAYAAAGKKLNVLPQDLQAITWTVYRRLRDLRSYDDNLPF